MKNKFIKSAILSVPIVLGISMIFMLYLTGGNSYGASIFESEQDYKLKFVDSSDFITLGESSAVILPFEILSVENTNEGIFVKTHENAIIYAPISCAVISYDKSTRELELCANSIKVRIKGLISGVREGDKIDCGQVIGSVDGNSCLVQVLWGSKKLTLEELKAVL